MKKLRSPCGESPELSQVPTVNPGVGQNIALNASTTSKNSACISFAFLLHSDFSCIFFQLLAVHVVCADFTKVLLYLFLYSPREVKRKQ